MLSSLPDLVFVSLPLPIDPSEPGIAYATFTGHVVDRCTKEACEKRDLGSSADITVYLIRN